jgi:hypothetical protein
MSLGLFSNQGGDVNGFSDLRNPPVGHLIGAGID